MCVCVWVCKCVCINPDYRINVRLSGFFPLSLTSCRWCTCGWRWRCGKARSLSASGCYWACPDPAVGSHGNKRAPLHCSWSGGRMSGWWRKVWARSAPVPRTLTNQKSTVTRGVCQSNAFIRINKRRRHFFRIAHLAYTQLRGILIKMGERMERKKGRKKGMQI